MPPSVRVPVGMAAADEDAGAEPDDGDQTGADHVPIPRIVHS